MAVIVKNMEQNSKQLLKYLIAPLIVLLIVVYGVGKQPSVDGFLHVDFLDVGQGDAIFIQTIAGNQIVIDGGPSDQVIAQLSKRMPFWDRTIEALMLTHPDADHVSGFVDILKRYEVKQVFMTEVSTDTAVYKKFIEMLDEKQVEKTFIRTGHRIWMDHSTVFDVYYPPSDIAEHKLQTNDTSIVGKLIFGKTKILFTGDSSSLVERFLLPQFDLDADILKVGHHGSRTSTSPEFVSEVSPQFSVIGVGSKNNYGHPTQMVLDILRAADSEVLRTDQMGTIEFESDGFNLYKR